MKKVIILLSLVLLLQACSQEEFINPINASADFSASGFLTEQSKSAVDAIFGNQDNEVFDGNESGHTQSFYFANKEGARIQTQAGIIFEIPPHAFVGAHTGLPIDEELTLEVIEIFNKSDMISQNKPTNYQQTFLISGGEFFLAAAYKDLELKLAPGVDIDVELPVKVDNGPYENRMKLFSGDYELGEDGEETNRFVWNQSIKDTVKLRNTFPAAYVFSISNLGWINCDAFLNDPRPKTSMTVSLQGNVPAQACMVFIVPENMNSVMRIYRDMRGQFKSMASLPEGLEATLVAVAHAKGQSFISTTEIIVKENDSYTLSLSPASSQEIKDALSVLNQ